jgi:hypothetical protein
MLGNVYVKPGLVISKVFGCVLLTMLSLAAVTGHVSAARSGGVSVKALVEKETVSQGEPFVFQIHLEGADISPGSAQPDMSGFKDFSVESLGGQSNNRSSISIVNGKMNKVESFGYVYSFRLTPKKTGRLVIPSVSVAVDTQGTKVLRTEQIAIQVNAPESSDDFQLEVHYSKTRFYVGEPVILTVTWYLSRGVEGVNFNLPVLETEGLTVMDPKVEQDPGKQYVQIQVGPQGPILAEKGSKTHKAREYTTVTFRKVLFAREPSTFQIPESTVSSRSLVGYSRSGRSNSPFDDFFNDDFFNPGRRGVYKTFVARSEPVVLTSLELPREGRPANFSGCVGSFHIETSADPTEVSVGDPVSLRVSISGTEYLDNIELPPLSKDPELEKDFKIPEEMAAGLIKDGSKVFTQTLRAKSEEVKAIPPVRFSYFNPDIEQYQTASSKPIPLRVKPTRIVTEADIEGRAAVGPAKNELEAWSKGIAYNYEGPEVLENESRTLTSLLRSPLWLSSLVLPFSLYLALFVFVKVRRKQISDPDGSRSRKALATFAKRIETISRNMEDPAGSSASGVAQSCSSLLDGVRRYLGDKLRIDGAALTFADVESRLRDRNVDAETIRGLNDIFTLCEQGYYGGGVGSPEVLSGLAQDALRVVRSLDRKL